MTLFGLIQGWLKARLGRQPWKAVLVADLPEQLLRRKVYLVGEDIESCWFSAMLCPCGCGELIQLSLIPKDEPRWTAAIGDDGRVTLRPSVWRVRGCHSHFVLSDGMIHWCRNGRPRYGRSALGRAQRTCGYSQPSRWGKMAVPREGGSFNPLIVCQRVQVLWSPARLISPGAAWRKAFEGSSIKLRASIPHLVRPI